MYIKKSLYLFERIDIYSNRIVSIRFVCLYRRLNPIVPHVVRDLPKDIVVMGYHIPAQVNRQCLISILFSS